MTLRLYKVSLLIAAIAMFALPSIAQAQVDTADTADTPQPIQAEAVVAQADARTAVSERVAAALRAPRNHDGLFQAVSAAFVVTASSDLSVSMYQIGRGTAREVGFGAPWQDSPVVFAVTKSAMAAVMVYGLQRMHKTRPKTALVLGIAATAFEGWLTVRGARMGQ